MSGGDRVGKDNCNENDDDVNDIAIDDVEDIAIDDDDGGCDVCGDDEDIGDTVIMTVVMVMMF